MRRDTKVLLFEKGAEFIHLKGYNSTGIQEILKAANVPKGSFYFHFKSKEDYILQRMDYFDRFMENWQEMISYLNAHRKLTLATVSPDGKPMAHTVEYVAVGVNVYIMTEKKTRKAANITKNPNVAYTVDEDYDDWMKIQGIQTEGKAVLVTDPNEAGKIQGMYMNKFPQLKEFPQDPAIQMVLFKIEPTRAVYIDNLVHWGYRDIIEF